MLCCSDGVSKTRNPQGEEYGSQRLAECASKHYTLGAEDMIQMIRKDLRDFSGDAEPIDDRGIIVLRVMRDRPTA